MNVFQSCLTNPSNIIARIGMLGLGLLVTASVLASDAKVVVNKCQ